jgi:hypothetical protein
MDARTFENVFGKVTLHPIGSVRPLQELTLGASADAAGSCFSIDKAERLTLITENREVRICFSCKRAYIILKLSATSGVICRPEIEGFTCCPDHKSDINVKNQEDPL